MKTLPPREGGRVGGSDDGCAGRSSCRMGHVLEDRAGARGSLGELSIDEDLMDGVHGWMLPREWSWRRRARPGWRRDMNHGARRSVSDAARRRRKRETRNQEHEQRRQELAARWRPGPGGCEGMPCWAATRAVVHEQRPAWLVGAATHFARDACDTPCVNISSWWRFPGWTSGDSICASTPATRLDARTLHFGRPFLRNRSGLLLPRRTPTSCPSRYSTSRRATCKRADLTPYVKLRPHRIDCFNCVFTAGTER